MSIAQCLHYDALYLNYSLRTTATLHYAIRWSTKMWPFGIECKARITYTESMVAIPCCSLWTEFVCVWILLIRLWEGLEGSVWHATFILEAVTLPALYVNHQFELLWALVSTSTEAAISSVNVISISSQAFNYNHMQEISHCRAVEVV